MNEKLYVIKCADCLLQFETDNPNMRVCPSCLEYRQPHLRRKKNAKNKALTFAEISHIGNVYYKIKRKYLHYGDIVKLISLNPNKCICCETELSKKNKHVCSKCEHK